MDKIKVLDMRGVQQNFFSYIKKVAQSMEVGQAFEVIQTFEPIPLYSAMKALGFEHKTDRVSQNEYHVVFIRKNILDGQDDKTPFKPAALLNYPLIDGELAELAVDFWSITWNSEKRTIPFKYRLLLSLANAVGAGRMRQATRELIKAYSVGATTDELSDIFELLAWNQGIGYFSSEIGPSNLFKAYKLIVKLEKKGKERKEIIEALMEKYGEKNPDVSVT